MVHPTSPKKIELIKTSVVMKFMKQLSGESYTWKSNRKNVEEVNVDQFVTGPIHLSGTMPYKTMGFETAHQTFNKYKKQTKDTPI